MRILLKLISYPLSALFYLLFGILLLLFEGVQRICFNVYGYGAHKKSVGLVNGLFLVCLSVLGTRFQFKIVDKIPLKVPIIIVSNHQSLWDIPPIIWFLRKLHPKFISKKELGHGIPTVSYNLRKGGSVLIDRKNPLQATREIKKVAEYISETNRSVVIFPEGTRSRDGIPKKFHRKGLITLFENAPEAYVLPITINNSWKLQRYGMFPIPMFTHLTFYVHPAIKVSEFGHEDLIDHIEALIKSRIISKES
jgi:1-acyl-sn-glycerol-3-phosphate acyltransferase